MHIAERGNLGGGKNERSVPIIPLFKQNVVSTGQTTVRQ